MMERWGSNQRPKLQINCTLTDCYTAYTDYTDICHYKLVKSESQPVALIQLRQISARN